MVQVAENTQTVMVNLTETEQSFIDTVCNEMGFASRNEFIKAAIVKLGDLKTQWPDSFRLLLNS